MAAMTGFSMPAIISRVGLNRVLMTSSIRRSEGNPAFRSAPELNRPPAPVSTTTRASRSPEARAMAAPRSLASSSLNALRTSGRFIVTTATEPVRS